MARSSRDIMRQITTERTRIRKESGEGDSGNDWLATYGDLMTLLLVFFVLFYIFSITGQLPLLTEALEAFQEETPREGTGFGEMTGRAASRHMHDVDGELVIDIPSMVLFESGRDEIKRDAIPYLEAAVDSMKQILVEFPDAHIRVEGYTDNRPIHNFRFRSNWELSVARAISVVRYLIQEHSFQPEQLQAMGYGEYNPVAPNDTPENRARNRRVSIKVVRQSGVTRSSPRTPTDWTGVDGGGDR